MARVYFVRLVLFIVIASFSLLITTLTVIRTGNDVTVASRFVDEGFSRLTFSTTPRSAEENTIDKYKKIDLTSEMECDEECQVEIQRIRKDTVTEQCAALGMKTPNLTAELNAKFLKKLDHFFVLDKYKIIYSYIPKAGCTSWKRVLLVLSGRANSTQLLGQKQTHILADKHLRTLSTYTLDQAKLRLESYTKFTFVRDPFARLLSAYRDKLEKPTSLNGRFRKDWSKKMKKLTEVFRRYRLRAVDLNTTFHEFVEYLSDPAHNLLDPSEEHWIEMYRLSHPCAIEYDFIGRVETLERDTNFVLKNIIKVPSKTIYFPNSTNPTNSSGSRKLQKYFSDVPLKDVKALYDRFAPDFRLFGYNDPTDLLGQTDSQCRLRRDAEGQNLIFTGPSSS